MLLTRAPCTLIPLTSGNAAYTSTLYTDPPGTALAGTYVVVNVPTYPTITNHAGSVAYTSTLYTDPSVVVRPTQPAFKVSVTDFSSNFYGYLDVLDGIYSGTTSAHGCGLTQSYSAASLFYIDPSNQKLTCQSGAGSSIPLGSCQRSGSSNAPFLFDTPTASGNVDIDTTFWDDQTLHVTNAANGQYLAALCSSILYLVGTIPSGCQQVVLTPCYNSVSFTTRTITSGTGVVATRTQAPAGTAVTGVGTVNVVVPASCSASPGLQYIVRPNPASRGSTTTDPYYSNFNPNVYNNPQSSPYSTINFSGITDEINLGIPSTQSSNAVVYGVAGRNVAYTAFIYRGYFLPNTTGSYTFTLANPDDVGYLWVGTKAVSSWSAANADAMAGLNTDPDSVTVSLTAGTYVPFRMIFADGTGALSWQLKTTEPNGRTYTDTYGMFRPPSCGPDLWTTSTSS
ncbi:hypothetical protein UCDDS831_g03855 [Diplodia seriata]|uniref:PA14 domain-containing protein n=1 Tax=Diplodia seriata TaxID=420778 RepID=A0A0G2EHZ4_9PEZI|nr:hypothetical protein UCDDS831_g03855 [Diplodia seriata]